MVLELDKNYLPIREFNSFINGKNTATYNNLKEWSGKFIAGHAEIIKLDNKKKFVKTAMPKLSDSVKHTQGMPADPVEKHLSNIL